jgi:hypothetical protein
MWIFNEQVYRPSKQSEKLKVGREMLVRKPSEVCSCEVKNRRTRRSTHEEKIYDISSVATCDRLDQSCAVLQRRGRSKYFDSMYRSGR